MQNHVPHPLTAAFYERPTLSVARNLLGCHLWRLQNEEWHAWRIVETEAYTGDDPACHAYQRKTGRAAMLYAEPGTTYVYMTYGMHFCMNAVTEAYGIAGAVLIRALEPINREKAENHQPAVPKQTTALLRTDGPGRLTRALGITQEHFNGTLLTSLESGLIITSGDEATLTEEQVITTTRIGIRKAVELPWRFYIRGNPWISVRDKIAENAFNP